MAALGLPQRRIGAGFLRAPVWDRLRGFVRPTPADEIDVIYFDPADPSRFDVPRTAPRNCRRRMGWPAFFT